MLSLNSQMFSHPSNIPVKFALAIYRIMHDVANYRDWEVIDSFHIDDALPMIRKILEMNKVERVDQEMKWWEKEIRSK